MSAVTTFKFEGSQDVRTMTRHGEPWFVAADVSAVLDIGRTDDAVRRLDDDEKGTDTIRTLGGAQKMVIINESGLYSLILTSRKPAAKRFKKWLTADVLPAIRKTGRYEAKAAQRRNRYHGPDKARDRLSFTARDANGALINWRVPSRDGDWHEHVRIGEQWFGEIVALARTNPRSAYLAMREAGPALVQNLGRGHETGFFNLMAAAAVAAILQSPDGPALPFDLPDLGKTPSVSTDQFLAQAAPVQRGRSDAEQDARQIMEQHRASGITRMELRRRMRALGYSYQTISDAISRLFCMGWASVDKSGFIRAAA